MKSFLNTKSKIGAYFLKKQMNGFRRQVFFNNFEASNTIGILFNATDKEEFELVKKYVKYLRDLKKKVKAIGYFSSSEIPEMTYSKMEYDFFSKKDLNWYLKPGKAFVLNFIEEEYDLLIDLNLKDDFPLYYISALSRAKFKIGKFTLKPDLYDLMIDSEGDKGIKYFLRHIDHYLLQMNNSKGLSGAENSK